MAMTELNRPDMTIKEEIVDVVPNFCEVFIKQEPLANDETEPDYGAVPPVKKEEEVIISDDDHVCSLSKMELFEEWRKHKKEERNSRLMDFIIQKFSVTNMTTVSQRYLQLKISSFSSKLSEKWAAANMMMDRFLNKNKSWLEGAKIEFNISMHQPCASSLSVGSRPKKNFEDLSFKTKKRRVDEDLVRSRSTNEFNTVAEVANRLSGHRNVGTLIRKSSESSAKRKSGDVFCGGRQLNSDEALAYYVDSKCTSHSYKHTRKWSLKAGHQVFPSYHSLSKSKKLCYPSDISVTETRAEIKLQAILDKTTERLIVAQSEALKNVPSNSSLTLISKWGYDWCSGSSIYKQVIENSNATDEFLFVFALVPLRLIDGQNIIWHNTQLSSTLYCRPIKFIFSKETNEFTISETNKVLEEVSQLLPTHCSVDKFQITVKHDLLLTMTDGKVCNALTDTHPPQKCYICGATPKMMNGKLKDAVVKKEHYGFGLSILHVWIRFFECLLHISYHLNIKKWQARSDDDKSSVLQRSEEIKQKFKNQMGLIVDIPKPGYETTYDGNIARRFFMYPELSGEITGVDVNLIKKFSILLRTLSSGYDINVIEFEKLCSETRTLYLNLYSWYYMPVSVHKILVHSTEVIQRCILPIGQLLKESQEARNKDRRFREHHTRKQSIISRNIALLNMLLITSDPLINSLREVPRMKTENLPMEVLKLIVLPSIQIHQVASDVHPCDDEDYLVTDSSHCEIDDDSCDDSY